MNEVSRATLITRRCVSEPLTAKETSSLKNIEETQNVGQRRWPRGLDLKGLGLGSYLGYQVFSLLPSLGLGLSHSRPYKFHGCYKLLKKYWYLPSSFSSCKEAIEMYFLFSWRHPKS